MNDLVAKETIFPWQNKYSGIVCILQSGEVHIWYTRETKILLQWKPYYLVTVQVMFLFAAFVP